MSKLVKFGFFLAYLVLVAPFSFALYYSERFGCPADAFICGSMSGFSAGTWQGFVSLLLWVLIWYFPAEMLLYAATRSRLFRQKFKSYFNGFNLRKTTRRAVVVAALAVPAIYLLTYKKTWASPQVIFERDYVWSTPLKRGWNDVTAVTTWCVPGSRGAWNQGYVLTFWDGGNVDLRAHFGSLADQKKPIFAALHGRHFKFDDWAVDPNCISPFREMATEKP